MFLGTTSLGRLQNEDEALPHLDFADGLCISAFSDFSVEIFEKVCYIPLTWKIFSSFTSTV